MNVKKRVTGFVSLGEILRKIDKKNFLETIDNELLRSKSLNLSELIQKLQHYNGWFTPDMVTKALKALGESLREESIKKWISEYENKPEIQGLNKTVAVIMAGNIPAVGFHDFLSVLISGNIILAKLSSDDDKLLPAIADILTAIEPEYKDKIYFTTETIKDFDAIIATGSNNSARYFEYYFGKYPRIIRKNRNGIAILTGNETEEDLKGLCDDIFLYYGLGCRNVSRLFVPENYDFTTLLKIFSHNKQIAENHKYFNNYEYNKAIFLVNNTKHFDTGNLLITEKYDFSSPVSVLYYSFYKNENSLKNELMLKRENIQCIISKAEFLQNTIPFGKSQSPELWDYADGVDTMNFLLSL